MNPLCLGLELILLGARLCMGEPSFRAPDVFCPVIVERSAVWQRALRDERLVAAGSPRTDEASPNGSRFGIRRGRAGSPADKPRPR